MATAYTSLLGLALPVQGELAGTWGDTVNNYITSYVDAAVAGVQTVSTDTSPTLTKTTGTSLGSTSSQYAIINCTGARTALRTITVPAASKFYLVINGTTGGFGVKIVGSGPTTGVTIANGKAALIAWNGSDFVTVASNDASVITGVLAVANGGTGASSAGITAFNNITGYSASGATGTTSTNLVFSTSPTLTTPTLGVASATSINKVSFTAPATGATLTIADGKTLTANNTLTFSGTDGSTLNVGAGGTLGSAAFTASTAYAPAAGSGSITTVGTISSGTWQGSVIGSTYGGTGVNNAGRTLTINTNSGTVSFTNVSTTLTVANTASVSGTNTGDQTITLTGDVTGSGTGSFATTLANSGVGAGTYGGNNSIPSLTVDAKGRVTSATTVTPSGNWNINAAGLYGTPIFGYSTSAAAISLTSQGGPQVQSQGSGAAMVSFHRPGAYAINFGLDTDNVLKVGGWSLGAVAYTILHSGNYTSYSPTLTGTGASGTWSISISGNAANITAYTVNQSVGTANNVQFNSLGVGTAGSGTAGEIRATNNITAYYSDDRLKTKLGRIENALDKLCSLEGFYYEANETAQALGYERKREVGVSAQAVQQVLPEIVAPAPIDEKYLTVRYERALPLIIEAIKELRGEIAALKERV